MPKRITIQPHLSVDELETGYRAGKDPIERSHYQIIWLLANGRLTEEVAAVTGYSRNWIYELVWGYNRVGPESLGDCRHQNPGGEPLLSDVQQAQLWQALQGNAPDGGLWNGPKVADWMSEILSRKVSPQRGWEYLRGMRYRLRSPRPEHEESDFTQQQEWKKKLVSVVEQVQKDPPDADVEVWTPDEHRLGLKPVLRDVWVPEGEQHNRQCQLAFPMAVAVWLCSPAVGGDVLVDSAPRQYQTIQPGAS